MRETPEQFAEGEGAPQQAAGWIGNPPFDAVRERQKQAELAPFIDGGKVSGTTDTSLVSRLHNALGLGVRAVASPFIVGYVDVGHGSGRTAVFSGINYPF